MVTSRALPWLLLVSSLSACGGSTEVGGGGSSTLGAEVGGSQHEGGKEPPVGASPGVGATPGVGAGTGVGGDEPNASGGTSPDVGEGDSGGTLAEGGTGSAYPGKGFVVHEWGTDTIVVGADGSMQQGLHHEEEDLPEFVYDRIKAGTALGATASPSVTIKMETPVTYFYSDTPLTVRASVSFPQGVLTQWYPGVSTFLPPIAAPGSAGQQLPLGYADPVLDPGFPFVGQQCRDKYSSVAGGLLDWGDVAVLARGSDVSGQLPAAPLDRFSWDYARDVASNPIALPSGETERFLFYRGLGNFDLPVTVTAAEHGQLTLENHFSEAMGAVFTMNVGAERGAFNEQPRGVAAGSRLSTEAPTLEGAPTLDEFDSQLGQAVTRALDATGLYHDEALAMVNTWKRQWFRTPGVRLLYVIPQRWTDSSIPLTIEPRPDTVLRVMLIRVEVITPEQEAADVAAVAKLDVSLAEGKAYFAALGRFQEPRLRRALALKYSKNGVVYLDEIRTANTTHASGE